MKEEKENQKKKEEKINLKEAKEKKVSKKAVKTKDEATDNKAKKDVTKETKAKKTTSKAKAKAEKEDNAEVVVDVKTEEKTTVKDEKEKATVIASNNDATEEAEEAKVESVEESKQTKENNAKLEENIAKLKAKKLVKTNETKESSNMDTKEDDGEEIIIDAPKTDSENQTRKEKLEEQAELLEKKKTASFTLTPKLWIEQTKVVGIVSKQGKSGGTFAHPMIACEFASWIAPEFKMLLLKLSLNRTKLS